MPHEGILKEGGQMPKYSQYSGFGILPIPNPLFYEFPCGIPDFRYFRFGSVRYRVSITDCFYCEHAILYEAQRSHFNHGDYGDITGHSWSGYSITAVAVAVGGDVRCRKHPNKAPKSH